MEQELSGYLLDHARRKGYDLLTRPEVHFNTDSRLRLGEFGIQARLVKPPAREGEPARQADEGHTMVYKAAPPVEDEPTARPPVRPAVSRAVVDLNDRRYVLLECKRLKILLGTFKIIFNQILLQYIH